MEFWIQECPNCGYVANSFNKESSVTQEWLKSDDYTSCNGRRFQTKLIARFYKKYLIHAADVHAERAFNAALNAAWLCDVQNDSENAAYCRQLALDEFEKIAAELNSPRTLRIFAS